MGIRVVQWATGVTGRNNLQQIIDHPDLELVGVFVTSPDKDGVDAGTLIGRREVGVRATADRDAILGIEADCVLHNSGTYLDTETGDEEVGAILASGKNIVSIVPGYLWPAAEGEERARRLDAAGRAGSSTLLGTGLDPGFMDRLSFVLSGTAAAIDEIRYTACYDVRDRPRPKHIFEIMGIGKQPEEFGPESPRGTYYFRIFNETIHLLAAELETSVVRTERHVRTGLATRDLQIAAGTVAKGTVAAVEWTLRAELADGILVQYAGQRIAEPGLPGWNAPFGWSVEIDGDPCSRIVATIEGTAGARRPRAAALDPPPEPQHRANAATQIRAIPEVMAAPPGILRPHVFLGYSTRMTART